MNKTITFSKKAHELRQQIEDAISFYSNPYSVELFKHDIPNATEYIHVKRRDSTHITCAVLATIQEITGGGYVDVINGQAVLVIAID